MCADASYLWLKRQVKQFSRTLQPPTVMARLWSTIRRHTQHEAHPLPFVQRGHVYRRKLRYSAIPFNPQRLTDDRHSVHAAMLARLDARRYMWHYPPPN